MTKTYTADSLDGMEVYEMTSEQFKSAELLVSEGKGVFRVLRAPRMKPVKCFVKI